MPLVGLAGASVSNAKTFPLGNRVRKATKTAGSVRDARPSEREPILQ